MCYSNSVTQILQIVLFPMNKDVTCTFRLDQEIHAKLEKLLKERGIKKSDYIREAILKKMYDEVLLGLD